jgi:hypothetical protein
MQLQINPLVNAYRRYSLHISGPGAEGEAVERMQRALLLIDRIRGLVFLGIEANRAQEH